MRLPFLLTLFSACLASEAPPRLKDVPLSFDHYDLRVRFLPEKRRATIGCTVRVTNRGRRSLETLTIYLSGNLELKQVTIGLQLGGQKFIEVIFFKDKTAYDDFTRGNYEFGAQASAVAFSASASADLAYNGGVAIVTMAEGGLMYEAPSR